MVIACVPGSERGRLGCFATGEGGLDVLLQARSLWGRTISGISS